MSEYSIASHQPAPTVAAAVTAPEKPPEVEIYTEGLQCLPIQRKLSIGSVDEPLEYEADAVADRVMRMPEPFIQRKCGDCEKEEKARRKPLVSSITPFIQTKGEADGTASDGVSSQINTTRGSGSSMDKNTKSFMESRFGTDFSGVRIHTGDYAAEMSRELNAQAFTVGSDIYFNSGKYSPESADGKHLLAHELTHTVQQKNAVSRKIQRAVVRVGNQNVQIDYSPIINISPADYPTHLQTTITAWTGAAPSPATIAAITALSASSRRWVVFALSVLTLNTTAAHASLNKTDAVDRLIAFAPSATTQPLGGGSAQNFARELLTVSGWLEVAVAGGLTAPSAADQALINPILNPPASSGAAPGALNVVALQTRIDPALRSLVSAIDPARMASVGTRSIAAFQTLGDIILAEARTFFSPFANAARGNVFDLNPPWRASANIFDVTAMVPTQDQRISYLLNRLEIVGRNTSANPPFIDTNIFADTNFDGSRAADRAELRSIATTLEADATVQPIIDRLIQHTGRKSGQGSTTSIGLVTEFDSSRMSACQDHWRGIGTLCHELLHALVHPDFQAATSGVRFPQVLREGFTEVLGVQLFNNHVIPKAAREPAFKTLLETGVAGAPCPAPSPGTIGYQDAGSGAESIRARVGNDNFRAAYFLGRKDLIGI